MADARTRASRLLESVVADVRFALRFLRRNPTSTTTIVLVLSLGIGVNSALFSMIQSITMRPVPGMRLDKRHVQLHAVEQGTRGAPWQRRTMSYGELMDLSARTETFSAVAGFASEDVIIEREDIGSREVLAQFVTPNYFATLGVAPVRGQVLRDAGARDFDVVIADALWDELFARSDTAIGSVLRLNKVEVRVVGVAPPRFQGPFIARLGTSLWLPLSARASIVHSTDAWRA